MPQTIRIFISHTTLDERDSSLAHKLAAGLRENGSDIWIAPDNIPVGSEWKHEIVSAILRNCSHFLVIISAASSTSEWVLKEIKLAKERREADSGFTILPLIVGKTAPYAGSEFINKFQHVPYHNDFSDQLIAVMNCLNLRLIVPNQYSELTEGFVGRDYVFTAINYFLSVNDRGYFTIVGDPGEGKSTILSEYIRRTGCIAHFNIRAEGINRAEHCIKNINEQLSARYGLSLGPIPSDPAEYGKYWNNMLKRVSEQLTKAKRLVIAIDALDEVDLSEHTSSVNILFLPRYLPQKVYLYLHVAE
jgi:hypothetical protein